MYSYPVANSARPTFSLASSRARSLPRPFFLRRAPPLLLFLPISRRVEHNPTLAPAGKRVADPGTNLHSRTCVQRSVCARVKARKKLLLNAFQEKLLLVGIKESYLTRRGADTRSILRRRFHNCLSLSIAESNASR